MMPILFAALLATPPNISVVDTDGDHRTVTIIIEHDNKVCKVPVLKTALKEDEDAVIRGVMETCGL